MKKVYFVICLLVAMAGMIACAPAEDVQLGSQESDLASSEHIEVIATPEILDGESKEDNDSNQDSENIMPLPKDTEELFGFNPEALLLGKSYKEIKETCPDLEYAGNFMGSEYFYCAARKMFFEFESIDILDVESPKEEAACCAVDADAAIIFPDMRTNLSKSDIEAVIGTEVEAINNSPGTELIGEYIAIFDYKGCWFRYLPEKKEEDILSDKQIRVSWMPEYRDE